MIYFIFLFYLFFFYLSWRRIDWALMFIIAALPSYLIRFKILGIPFTLLESMILIAFAVWLFKNTNFRKIFTGEYGWKELKEAHNRRLPYPFGIELILVLIVTYISIFVAGLTDEALGIWKAYFFEPALFFILVLNVFKPTPTLPFEQREGALVPPLNERGGQEGFAGVEKIVLSLAAGAFVVSVLAIYQKITGNLIFNPLWAAADTRRVVSFFGYPNAVGLYLGPIVMILIGYLFSVIPASEPGSRVGTIFTWIPGQARDDKLKFIFVTVTVILSIISILFAKSIGAVIGLVAAGFVFGIFAGRKWRWATLIITGIAILGILAVPNIRMKAINKITFQDLSGQIRLQQWNETWKMMTGSPVRFIFGTGLSGYQKNIAPYHQEGIFFNSEHEPWEEFHRKTVFNEAYRIAHWQPVEIYMYPHNIILNFWTELGVAGVVLFVWIIIKFFLISISNFEFRISKQNLISNDLKLENSDFIQNSKFKIQNYISLGLIGAMIVIIVHGIVDVPYFKNDLSVLFWLCFALVCLIDLRVKELKK